MNLSNVPTECGKYILYNTYKCYFFWDELRLEKTSMKRGEGPSSISTKIGPYQYITSENHRNSSTTYFARRGRHISFMYTTTTQLKNVFLKDQMLTLEPFFPLLDSTFLGK